MLPRYAVAAVLIAAMWARLERPAGLGGLVLMAALGAVPVLAPRLRLPAFAAAAVVALELSVRLSPHRFWHGFLDFYDYRLPFDPTGHLRMHEVILVAIFAFTLAVALAVTTRRVVLAVVLFLVGAGWPATLLAGNGQDIQLPAGVELRHVLNAVWLARVAPNRGSFLELTTGSQRLAERVRAFQREVARPAAQRPFLRVSTKG